MNVRLLIFLVVICSVVTFSACSACSPATPPASGNTATAGNSVSSLPPGVTPANDGRPVSRSVPQGPANPAVQMDGPDAGPIRITFEQGKNSSTLAGKVENTGRVDHVVSGSSGQTMTVSITSTDENAAFWIQHHKGKEMNKAKPADNARSWTGKLDQSGDYYVIVKGAKGAADYQLTVTLK